MLYQRINNLIHVVLYHQYSLIGWGVSYHEKRTLPKARLIHVDAPGHYDANDYDGPSTNHLKTYLQQGGEGLVNHLRDFISAHLDEKDGDQNFFPLALYLDLIDDGIIYVPSGDISKVNPITRFYQVRRDNIASNLAYDFPHLVEYRPSGEHRMINFEVCSIDKLAEKVKGLAPEQIIMGIDLDYFVHLPTLGDDSSNGQISTAVSDFVEKLEFIPGVITIAISPRYLKNFSWKFILEKLVEGLNKRYKQLI